MTETTGDLAARLGVVRDTIEEAAGSVGREPSSVTLIAVSKGQPLERIEAALAAGERVFGENYVQEAASRWPALRERYPGVTLHLIGALQTNKARDAVALFDVIQTLDRPRLAAALAKEMARLDRRLGCFVQVNTGAEPQKAGVMPDAADAFIATCRDDHGLAVEGLMAIPPADEDIALHTAFLAKIAERNGLSRLSIGMSDDYADAIRFGATHVRVGSAIFGQRLRPAAAR
jgi:pyridoxal phosphate enzyme (YggS family)